MEKQLLQVSSKEDIAFKLMDLIMTREFQAGKAKDERSYFLRLYQECLFAVSFPEEPK
jgi:hypothetical protein